jgi:5-methylcytosine-specific restriction endonuclease McrA
MSKPKSHSNYLSYKWNEGKFIEKDMCFECGDKNDIHYHHVVPETLGGTKTIPLCIVCHGKVHGRDFVRYKHLQKIGIEKAKKQGKFLGRKPGSTEDIGKLLLKEKNQKIIEGLKKGNSYKIISNEVGCSQTTIVKVVKIYEEYHNRNLLENRRKKIRLDEETQILREKFDVSKEWFKL